MGATMAAKSEEKKSKSSAPEESGSQSPQLLPSSGAAAGLPRFVSNNGIAKNDSVSTADLIPKNDSQKSSVIARMGSAFGTSFDSVHLRTDSAAAERAAGLQARAYTDGKEIGFARGAFAPETRSGMHTIAHEFAHVAQSRSGRTLSRGGSALSSAGSSVRAQSSAVPQDEIEAEADAAAQAVLGGEEPEVGYASIIVATQKQAPEKLPDAPPRGLYQVSVDTKGTYYYTFDLEDAQAFGDRIGYEVFRRHFHDLYPGAPAGAEDGTVAFLKDIHLVNRKITPHPAANGRQIARFYFDGETEQHITNFMRDKYALVVGRTKPGQGTYAPAGTPPSSHGTPSPTPAHAAPAEKKVPVNGTTVHLPDSISEDQQLKALQVVKEINAVPDPSAQPQTPADKDLYLTDEAIKMLLDIDKARNRQALVDYLKRPGTAAPGSLQDKLERALAEVDIDESRKSLDLKDSGATRDEKPIENRPVHGHIQNRAGYIVTDQTVNFEFIVEDDRDAFRVPMIGIKWVAYPEGKPNDSSRQTEVTKYIPLNAQSPLNDRYFNISFDTEGTYVIEAFVNHNFFTSNHFTQRVRVLSQKSLLQYLQKTESLKDFANPPTQSDPALFDVGGLQGLQIGETATGKLDPRFTVRTIEAQLQDETDKEKNIRDYLKGYEGVNTDEAKAIRSWGEDYLETLEKSRGKIEQDKGATPLAVRGTYVSKTKEVPSKTLDLLCYFKKSGNSYDLKLYDFTHVYENEDYRFSGAGNTVKQAENDAFTSEANAYPAGLLSVTFQIWDESAQRATDQYIQFTMTTETIGKSLKSIVFSTAADLAVNLLSIILMVIPGFAPLGLAIAIAYNSAKTLSEFQDSLNKGTMTSMKAGIAFGTIALNLIPLAGRGARLFTIAGKAFHVVDAVAIGGNVLLVSLEGMQQVEQLRNGVIQDLSDLDRKIKGLEVINMADPSLPDLRNQREELIAKGKNASKEVFTELYAKAGLMMVGQHLISEYAGRKFNLQELKNFGMFRNESGNTSPHFDYVAKKIVGDEVSITPAELEKLQRTATYSNELETVVPAPGDREQIVKAIGDRQVEIHTGAPETKLTAGGDKAILNIADNATPADIVKEAQKTPAPASEKEAAVHAQKTDPNAVAPKPVEPPVVDATAPKKPSPPPEPPSTPEQAEAQAEGEMQTEKVAKAAYEAAKKKGYGKGKGPGKSLDEQGFINKYKNGEVYNLENNRWEVPESAPKKVTPPFPKGTTPEMAFDFLAGEKSSSSFKAYFKMLEKFGIATKQKVLDSLGTMVGAKERSVDGVRHGLKETFRPEVMDAMFTGPDGKPLDLKASQKKMLDMTSGLNSSDMGTLAEDWVQRAGVQTAAETAKTATDASATARTAADLAQAKADAATARAAEAQSQADAATTKAEADAAKAAADKARQEAATAKAEADKAQAQLKSSTDTPRQVEIKAADHPPMKSNRKLDRIEGDTIGEVKSGKGRFSEDEQGELDDHLALVGTDGATIDVKGVPTTVKKVRWKSINPEGAKANAEYMKGRLKDSESLSWEATNSAYETKTFTAENVGEIDSFLGIKKKK